MPCRGSRRHGVVHRASVVLMLLSSQVSDLDEVLSWSENKSRKSEVAVEDADRRTWSIALLFPRRVKAATLSPLDIYLPRSHLPATRQNTLSPCLSFSSF